MLVIVALFWAVLIYLSSVFFVGQMVHAAQKPFWGDELFGLNGAIRGHTYLSTVFDGADGQISPSPLDYVLCKILNDLHSVFHFGLMDEVYYRLIANITTLICAVLIAIIFYRQVIKSSVQISLKVLQLLILAFVPICLWYSPMVYYYAAEIRPYALWTALWFVVLGITLWRRDHQRYLIAALVLLALTATASLFQMAAMITAIALVRLFEQKSIKEIIKELFRIFFIPILINFYYLSKSYSLNAVDAGGTWESFMEFWVHRAYSVPMMIAVSSVALIKKETRFLAIAPLSVLFIFLLGPVIFWIARLKGMYYAERQFVYYEVVNAVYLLTIIQLLPYWLNAIKQRWLYWIVILGVAGIGCAVTLKKKTLEKFYFSQDATIAVFSDNKIVRKSGL